VSNTSNVALLGLLDRASIPVETRVIIRNLILNSEYCPRIICDHSYSFISVTPKDAGYLSEETKRYYFHPRFMPISVVAGSSPDLTVEERERIIQLLETLTSEDVSV
jgi:hypothetical protein